MEVDEPSYDILEWFPILYCQNVFKYLDGKDVIQASAVNKEWRRFSGESQQMKKVKLVFDEENSQRLKRQSVDMIKKSQRKYQNIEFRGISSRFTKYIPDVLAHRAGSWKSVEMWGFQIYEQEEWTTIFDIIEPSVEGLSFNWMETSENPVNAHLRTPKWTFPRLKDLTGDPASSPLCEAFVHCTSLVNINWYSTFRRPIRVMSTLLRNNYNLQNLTVATRDFLLENSVDFKSKLKKLHLFRFHPAEQSLEITRSFLETQAQTLESLDLDARFNRDCLDLILNMPKLTSFTADYTQMKDAISDGTRPLPANKSITNLKVKGWMYMEQQQYSFETLFRALTNLKHFKCVYVNDQLLSTLAREVPDLESFEAIIFDVSRFPEGDIFPDIKEFKVQRFRQGLQEPTGDGHFASLAREEMRKIR